MNKKLTFTLKKINNEYVIVSAKCKVLNLRQAYFVCYDFLLDSTKQLLAEQKGLLAEIKKTKKIPAKHKQFLVRLLKGRVILHPHEIEKIKDLLK